MNLRTVSRVAGGLAVLVASAAGVATWAGTNAGALQQDPLTATPTAPATQTYGPLAGGGGGTTVDRGTFVDPETCATSAYCDIIPVHVDSSSLDPDREEWFVNFEVSWETQVLEVPAYGDLSANDLDIYVFTDPYDDSAGPDEDGDLGGAAGATGSEPEKIGLRNAGGDFLLAVNNFNGANTGYSVNVSFDVRPYPNPFESLPPDSSGGLLPSRPAAGPFRAPPPPSFAGVPDPAFTTPTPAPDLSLGGDAPDSSFGEDPGTNSFDEALASPDTVPVSSAAPATFAAPSGLALVLWLLVLPLALVALGSGLLARRQATRLVV
jgi:hypothetical protein